MSSDDGDDDDENENDDADDDADADLLASLPSIPASKVCVAAPADEKPAGKAGNVKGVTAKAGPVGENVNGVTADDAGNAGKVENDMEATAAAAELVPVPPCLRSAAAPPFAAASFAPLSL